MARTSIKATYSLDVETVRALESMARRLGITKSEALRRAIRAAARETAGGRPEALAALEELQESLALTPARARDWAEQARRERRGGSRRRERRAG